MVSSEDKEKAASWRGSLPGVCYPL